MPDGLHDTGILLDAVVSTAGWAVTLSDGRLVPGNKEFERMWMGFDPFDGDVFRQIREDRL